MTQNAGLIVFFLLNAFPGLTFSQSPPAGLPDAWVSFVHDAQLRYGQASLAVLNEQTGNLVFRRNQNTGMTTASTMKVITSTSAIYLHGSDFRCNTRIGYTGRIANAGGLQGTIL